jgi:hypothetical protein
MSEGISVEDAIECVWGHMSMLRRQGCSQVEGEITAVCDEIVHATVKCVAPKPAEFITLRFKVDEDD